MAIHEKIGMLFLFSHDPLFILHCFSNFYMFSGCDDWVLVSQGKRLAWNYVDGMYAGQMVA